MLSKAVPVSLLEAFSMSGTLVFSPRSPRKSSAGGGREMASKSSLDGRNRKDVDFQVVWYWGFRL